MITHAADGAREEARALLIPGARAALWRAVARAQRCADDEHGSRYSMPLVSLLILLLRPNRMIDMIEALQ